MCVASFCRNNNPEKLRRKVARIVLTVFHSTMRDDGRMQYMRLAPQMSELAKALPGCKSLETFIAEDGECVTRVNKRAACGSEKTRSRSPQA